MAVSTAGLRLVVYAELRSITSLFPAPRVLAAYESVSVYAHRGTSAICASSTGARHNQHDSRGSRICRRLCGLGVGGRAERGGGAEDGSPVSLFEVWTQPSWVTQCTPSAALAVHAQQLWRPFSGMRGCFSPDQRCSCVYKQGISSLVGLF